MMFLKRHLHDSPARQAGFPPRNAEAERGGSLRIITLAGKVRKQQQV